MIHSVRPIFDNGLPYTPNMKRASNGGITVVQYPAALAGGRLMDGRPANVQTNSFTRQRPALTADRRLLRRLLFRAKRPSSVVYSVQRRLASEPGINRSFLMKKRFIRASAREGREKGRRLGVFPGRRRREKGPRRVSAWLVGRPVRDRGRRGVGAWEVHAGGRDDGRKSIMT